MKRLLLVALVLLVALPAGAVLAFNLGFFQDRLEREARAASGLPVRLGKVELLYSWPPHVRIGPTSVSHPAAEVRVERMDAVVRSLRAPYFVSLEIFRPRVEVKTTEVPKSAATPSAPAAGGAPAGPPPLGLELRVREGELTAPMGKVSRLELFFSQRQLMKSAAQVKLDAVAGAAMLPVPVPVSLDTGDLNFSEEFVRTAGVKLRVAGLSARLTGASFFKEGRHRWHLELDAPDLTQLPPPPPEIPVKNWSGAVSLRAEVQRLTAAQPWSVEGALKAERLAAEVKIAPGGAALEGPVALAVDTKFSAVGPKISVSGLTAHADLSRARLAYGDLLTKAAGVPLVADVTAAGTETKLNLSALALRFWNLQLKASGQIETAPPFAADLTLDVAPTDLSGAEKLLTPLKASPVKGVLSLLAKLKGPLADPLALGVRLERLSLKGFAGVAAFDRPGVLQVRGPLTADVEAKGEWAQKSVKSAEARGRADLSRLALSAGPLRKEAGQKLETRFSVRNAGEAIMLNDLFVDSYLGRIAAKGTVEDPKAMKIDLQVSAKPLSLSEMRVALPPFRELLPKGTLEATLRLKGRPDFDRPWSDWPLAVSGQVSAQLPEYKMVSAPEPGPPPKGAPAPPPPPPASFLPKGALTAQLALEVGARVDTFQKDALTVKGVQATGRIAGGHFRGRASVREVFGGRFDAWDLDVPLLELRPVIQGATSWSDLVVQDALAFAKPQYKEFASGRTKGQAEFATVLPAEEGFLEKLKLKGEAKLEPVTLNSVKIGQMINDLLAKAPMLKLKPMKAEPLRGRVQSTFQMAGGTVNLPGLVAVDEDQSELDLKGKVTVATMQGDLVGTFYWAKPTVTGCLLEGNADAKGRLAIPLALKGDLMSPGLSLLSDVAGKLAGKALDCEKKKLVEKVKTEGKQKIEKEIKKQLKGLFGG